MIFLPPTEIDDHMQKVKKWLTDEGIFREQIVDEQASYNFQIELVPNSGNLLYVVQPKMSEDLILIVGGVSMSENYYQALISLPKSEHDRLIWDLRFNLLFQNPDFCMIPNDENFNTIQFQNRIYFDSLTKNNLIKSIRDVHRCILFVIWKLQQRFGGDSSQSQTQMYT